MADIMRVICFTVALFGASSCDAGLSQSDQDETSLLQVNRAVRRGALPGVNETRFEGVKSRRSLEMALERMGKAPDVNRIGKKTNHTVQMTAKKGANHANHNVQMTAKKGANHTNHSVEMTSKNHTKKSANTVHKGDWDLWRKDTTIKDGALVFRRKSRRQLEKEKLEKEQLGKEEQLEKASESKHFDKKTWTEKQKDKDKASKQAKKEKWDLFKNSMKHSDHAAKHESLDPMYSMEHGKRVSHESLEREALEDTMDPMDPIGSESLKMAPKVSAQHAAGFGKPGTIEEVTSALSNMETKQRGGKIGPFQKWQLIHDESNVALTEAVHKRAEALNILKEQGTIAQKAVADGDASLALQAVSFQADANKIASSAMRTALQKVMAAEDAAVGAGKAAARMAKESEELAGHGGKGGIQPEAVDTGDYHDTGAYPEFVDTDTYGVHPTRQHWTPDGDHGATDMYADHSESEYSKSDAANKKAQMAMPSSDVAKFAAMKSWEGLHATENAVVAKAVAEDADATQKFIMADQVMATAGSKEKALEALSKESYAYEMASSTMKEALETALSAEKAALFVGQAEEVDRLGKVEQIRKNARNKANFELDELGSDLESTKMQASSSGDESANLDQTVHKMIDSSMQAQENKLQIAVDTLDQESALLRNDGKEAFEEAYKTGQDSQLVATSARALEKWQAVGDAVHTLSQANVKFAGQL